MSILKSELKQVVTHEVGVRVEDALEAAKRELVSLEARKHTFHDAARAVEALTAAVDKDVEEGKFDLPVAEAVKRYLARSVHALQNLAMQAQNFTIAQTGKVQGLEQTVTLLKSIVDAEKQKMEQLRAVIASGAVKVEDASPEAQTPGARQDGVRPASIKEQRLAEEAAEKVEPEEPEEKVRRGRKPRAKDT